MSAGAPPNRLQIFGLNVLDGACAVFASVLLFFVCATNLWTMVVAVVATSRTNEPHPHDNASYVMKYFSPFTPLEPAHKL
jgi:hypothetical protein